MGLLGFRSTETIGAMTHPNIELLPRAWAAYDRVTLRRSPRAH